MPYLNKVHSNVGEVQPLVNKNQHVNNGQNTNFANVLKSAIDHVNKVDQEADVQAQQLARGNAQDLHNVMVSAQKASITIEAAVQIQQKVIDAYNEMVRMQV